MQHDWDWEAEFGVLSVCYGMKSETARFLQLILLHLTPDRGVWIEQVRHLIRCFVVNVPHQ